MTQLSLAMFKSDGTRRDFPLSKDRIIIGRKVNCDLRIPLTSVSRQHCELTVDGESVRVKDLGSSNGTFHNSVRVQEAGLTAGDVLEVGPVVFTLVVNGKPEDIKPVKTIVRSDGSAAPAVSAAAGSQAAALKSEELDELEELDLPDLIEDDEDMSPTVELDEDPIAALESLAGEDDDSDEFDDLDFFDIDDDDDR